ncbi:MAG: Sulfhydrogenase 2 subunit gamma [Methanosaeta sp. PtaU1.Bin112]|nr:MAG: Sulfhydrogenase 2 subunit gamma [Methanosaeta sp. PtaU1.Bin112]
MNAQFEAEVVETEQITASSRSIRFSRPEGFSYIAGQFIMLELESLGAEDKIAKIAKPLSLSSSPTEDLLEVTKRLTGHEFSNAVLSLKEGDLIRFSGPYGSFTFQGEHEKIAMLSGGIGITPLRSMIKYCSDRGLTADIVLFYSNRAEDDIPFGDEFESLKEKNQKLTIINTLTRPGPAWKGRTGRIDAAMISGTMADYQERVFFTSGPKKMVQAMQLALQELNIPASRIRKEYFPGYD